MPLLSKILHIVNERPIHIVLGCSGSVIVIGALYKTWQFCQMNMDSDKCENKESYTEKVEKTENNVIQSDTVDLNFDNFKGCDSIKDELEEYVQYFQQRNKFTQIGGEISIGIVIVGGKGYGKTHLVQSFAGQTKTHFYQISLSEKDGGGFYCHGDKIEEIRELFTIAKDNSPSIVFIDDLDKQCSERDAKHKLHSFLLEMDKLTSADGVVIIVTTEYKCDLPDELFNSKRFEKVLRLNKPD